MDKKARIRAYKDTPRPMGIYRVWNTVNGKSLVGSSVNLPATLNRMRFQLEMGGHPHRTLQQEWREYGPEAFRFEVLDTLEPSDAPGADAARDLRALEAMWLEQLSPYGERGYNTPPAS